MTRPAGRASTDPRMTPSSGARDQALRRARAPVTRLGLRPAAPAGCSRGRRGAGVISRSDAVLGEPGPGRGQAVLLTHPAGRALRAARRVAASPTVATFDELRGECRSGQVSLAMKGASPRRGFGSPRTPGPTPHRPASMIPRRGGPSPPTTVGPTEPGSGRGCFAHPIDRYCRVTRRWQGRLKEESLTWLGFLSRDSYFSGWLQRRTVHSVTKPWNCRFGLHRYVKRHDTQDPNMQVCVRCGKQRIADAIWGVLGRRGL